MMQKYRADYTNTFRALTFDQPEDIVLFGTMEYAQWYELWQARLDRQQESKASSHQLMRNSNPALIPRNHRVEAALESAVEHGDYSVMERLLVVLSSPTRTLKNRRITPHYLHYQPIRTGLFAVLENFV